MNTMQIMDVRAGDLVVEWDPTSMADTERARSAFDVAVGGGRTAVERDPATSRVTPIRRFNPDAKSIVVLAPIIGG